jgi:hypothetical protein
MTEIMKVCLAFQTQLTFYLDERYWRKKLNKIWGILLSNDNLITDLQGSCIDICNRNELSQYVLEDVLIQYIDDLCAHFLLLLKKSFIEDSNIEEVLVELTEHQVLQEFWGTLSEYQASSIGL